MEKRRINKIKKLPKSNIICLSFFKRNPSYNGVLFDIRRENDNDEISIGFCGNKFDEKKLKDFVGNSNGFLKNWYSQDIYDDIQSIASQTSYSSQPQIATNGIIHNYLIFDGIDDVLIVNKSEKLNLNNKISAYCKTKFGTDSGYIFCENETSIDDLNYALYRSSDRMSLRLDYQSFTSRNYYGDYGVTDGFNVFFGNCGDEKTVKSKINNYKSLVDYEADVRMTNNTKGPTIGARNSTGTAQAIFVELQLKEILIFNKAIERNDIEWII